jgi:hypothetical protein
LRTLAPCNPGQLGETRARSETGGYVEFFAASGFRLTDVRPAVEGLAQAVALLPDLIVIDFGYDGD